MTKEEWKIEHNKSGIEMSMKIIDPFNNKSKYSQPEHRDFNEWIEEFETNKKNMVVTKMERKIENDVLKSLVLYGFFQTSEAYEQQITTNNTSQKESLGIHDQMTIKSPPNSHVIVFGDDDPIVWRNYIDILQNTAKWLHDNKRLQAKDLPVYVSSGKRYLINITPNHADGRPFIGNYYKISDGMFLLTNLSGPECMKNSKYLMQRFAREIKYNILE